MIFSSGKLELYSQCLSCIGCESASSSPVHHHYHTTLLYFVVTLRLNRVQGGYDIPTTKLRDNSTVSHPCTAPLLTFFMKDLKLLILTPVPYYFSHRKYNPLSFLLFSSHPSTSCMTCRLKSCVDMYPLLVLFPCLCISWVTTYCVSRVEGSWDGECSSRESGHILLGWAIFLLQ